LNCPVVIGLKVSFQVVFVFVKLIMSAEMSIVTAGWFMLIAFIFSHHLFKNEIQKVQHIAERFIGIALILLGLKVAYSTSK
jgi:uncharacterized membrane protein